MGRSMRARKEVDYSDPGELSLAEIRRGAPGSASRGDHSQANSTDTQKVKTKNSESPSQASHENKQKERPKPKVNAEGVPKNLDKATDKRRSTSAGSRGLSETERVTTEVPPMDESASASKNPKVPKPARPASFVKPTPPSNRALPAKRPSPTKHATPTKRSSPAKPVPQNKVASVPSKMASGAVKFATLKPGGKGSTSGRDSTDKRGDRYERQSAKRPRVRSSAQFDEVVVSGADAGNGKENTVMESDGKPRKDRRGSNTRDGKDHENNTNTIDGARRGVLLSARGSKPPAKSKASCPRPPEPENTSAFDLPDGSGDEDEQELRSKKTRVASMADDEDDTPTPPQFPKRKACVSPRKTPAVTRGGDGIDDIPSPAPTTENTRDISSGKVGSRGGASPSDANAYSSLKPAHAPAATAARSPAKLAGVTRRRGDEVSAGANSSRKSDLVTAVTASSDVSSKRQRTMATQAPSTPGLGVPALPPRAPRPLPSPGTPAVTQAQEQFLSELRVLLGSIGDVASSGADGTDATASSNSTASSAGPLGAGGGAQRDQEKKLSEEVEYWKGRFEELSSLRETVPEMQLELFREHAAMREQAAQELIDHLRKQVSDARGTGVAVPRTTAEEASATPESCLVSPPPPCLPSQTPARRARSSTPVQAEDELEADHPLSSPRSSAYVRSLEDKLEHHRKVIRLYQNLSSLAIQVQPGPKLAQGGAGEGEDGDEEEVMTCTAVNHLHRRAVRFELRVPGDENAEDFNYRATGNRHLLPEYMQHELSFSKKQCPLFLTKLLQNLFRS